MSGPADGDMFDDARAYERFMERWSRRVAPLLVDFAGIPEEGRVLDVGCGTGALAMTIAERKPRCQVAGVDLSTVYVSYASVRSRNHRVSFQAGDAQRLEFADAAFDASLSLLAFNFIPDPRRALAEVRRVTRPSGRIAAAVWDYGEGMRMLRLFWDAAVALDPAAERLDEKHLPLCRAGELRDLWNQGGLERVEERPLEISMEFESFEDYWDPFLLGQGPAGAYVKRLAPEGVTALRERVKSQLPPAGPSGTIGLRARVWAVRGDVRRRPAD